MVFSKKAIVTTLTFALFLSAAAGAVTETMGFMNQIPNILTQKQPGQKFTPLAAAISAENQVGFVSKAVDMEYYKDLYQAQHVLAPIIVEEGTDPQFVVVSGYSETEFNALQNNLGSQLVMKLSGNVYLLESNE